MKKLVSIAIILALIAVSAPAFAAKGGQKGASAQAYEHASDKAMFNRATDWFATIGKSKEEKAAILAERQAKRDAKILEKEADRAQKEAKKKSMEANEKIKDAAGNLSK